MYRYVSSHPSSKTNIWSRVIWGFRRDAHRSARFWGITQRIVVIPYRSFRTTCRSHFEVSRNPCQQQSVQWDSQSFQQFCHLMLACGICWAHSDFESHFLDFILFTLEDGADRLFQTVGNKLSPICYVKTPQEGRSHFELLFSVSPVPIFSHVFSCHKFATVLRIDIGMQPTTLGFQAAVKSISGVTQQSDQRSSILSPVDVQLSSLTSVLWCGVSRQRLN